MFEIIRLKHAIAAQHHCRAEHTSSKLIVEKNADGTIWRGKVHLFDVINHPETQRCYGWIENLNGVPTCVTALKVPPVTSAQAAVREVLRERRAVGPQLA